MRKSSNARHALALITTALLTWVGLSFLTAKPVVGWVFLGLAAFRLGSWISQLVRSRRSAD